MKTRFTVFPLIALLVAALACNISSAAPPTLNPAQIDTLSAQTLAIIQWQTLSAQGTALPPPGNTEVATAGPGESPTNTPLPSVTPTVFVPSETSTPTVTSTPLPCNWAQLITDVTVPDGWETTPSDHFTKTWRLKNIGSCTWTSGYSLVFDHGDQMGAPVSQQLTPGTVAPGETIDVSVNLLSPNIAGTYQGFFKLRASDDTLFGIGADHNSDFYVKIKVIVVLPPPAVAPMTQSVSSSVNLTPGAVDSATATCPAGTVVTGGGFSVGLDVWVYTQLKQGNGWIAYAKNNAGVNRTLTTYAICLSYLSVTTTQVFTSVTVDAGHSATGTATCPAGSVVTGGGYTGKIDGSLRTFSEYLTGNAWQVAASNNGVSSTTFNVYAICLSGASFTTIIVNGNNSITAGGNGFAEAACPAGKVVTSGGFGLAVDLVPYYSSLNSGKWRVYAHNNAGSARALSSHAVCLG
jgi:hypothetical protein